MRGGRNLATLMAIVVAVLACWPAKAAEEPGTPGAGGGGGRIERPSESAVVKVGDKRYTVIHRNRIAIDPAEYEGKPGWFLVPGWRKIPPKNIDERREWVERLNKAMKSVNPEWKEWKPLPGTKTPLACHSYAASYAADWWMYRAGGKDPAALSYVDIYNGLRHHGFNPRELAVLYRYIHWLRKKVPPDRRRWPDSFTVIPLMKDFVTREPINYGIYSYAWLLFDPPAAYELPDDVARDLSLEQREKVEKELGLNLHYRIERGRYFMDTPPVQLFNHYLRFSGEREAAILKKALRKYGVVLARIMTTAPGRYAFRMGVHAVLLIGYGRLPAGAVYAARAIPPRRERGGGNPLTAVVRMADPLLNKKPRDPPEPVDVFIYMDEYGDVEPHERTYMDSEGGLYHKPTYNAAPIREIKEAVVFPHQLHLEKYEWLDEGQKVRVVVTTSFGRTISPADEETTVEAFASNRSLPVEADDDAILVTSGEILPPAPLTVRVKACGFGEWTFMIPPPKRKEEPMDFSEPYLELRNSE